MYLGDTDLAALLESVFHDVHHSADRFVYEQSLREMLVAHVRTAEELRLADLRDPVLESIGIKREQIASSPSEHYACTRRLARRIHEVGADSGPVHGIIWHYRQAELHATGIAEVLVVFADRFNRDVAGGRGSVRVARTCSRALGGYGSNRSPTASAQPPS